MTEDLGAPKAGQGRVEVIRIASRAEIRRINGAWDALVADDAHARLYQSSQLYFAWQDAAEVPDEPWFLLATVEGQPVGLAPLVRRTESRRGLRFRVLTFGQPRADLVIAQRRKDVVATFAAYLHEHSRDWDLLAFEDVPAVPGTVNALAVALGEHGAYRQGEMQAAPSETWMSVAGTWEAYLQSKGRHFRYRLKPSCERIERLGAVRYRRHVGTAEADAAFQEFIDMEESSWKANSGTRLSPQERGCFRALVRDASGVVRPLTFSSGGSGRAVSAVLLALHKRCYYVFVTFFDEQVRDLSPEDR